MIGLVMMFLACDSEEEISAPVNLIVFIESDNSIDGLISVTATADHSNFYTFNFGNREVKDNDGVINHLYTEEGTYSIIVKAHSTQGKFSEEVVSYTYAKKDVVAPTPGGGYTTPLIYPDYNLVWNDEFEGVALSNDWTYDIGNSGWGNNEWQYYREDNATLEGGFLTITAKKEKFGGSEYTSSRILTQGRKSFQYGRIDIRAKLPEGQGIWPAIWMLGSNFSTVGWPFCGEIDIMEMIGGGAGRDNKVYGTLHWDNNGNYACTCDASGNYILPSGNFSDEFHVFSIIWNPTSIVWYVDDQLFKTTDISASSMSEFRNDFFFIFNVAVGGNWPGYPDGSTTFPQTMMVDYVRVFQ